MSLFKNPFKKNPSTERKQDDFNGKKPLVDLEKRFDFSKFICVDIKGREIEAKYVQKSLSGNMQEDAQRVKEIVNIIGNNTEEDLRRYLFSVLPIKFH